jgi:ribonuclease HIII
VVKSTKSEQILRCKVSSSAIDHQRNRSAGDLQRSVVINSDGRRAPRLNLPGWTDEAGKRDYFGPLVVAGVFVDEQKASQLRALAGSYAFLQNLRI